MTVVLIWSTWLVVSRSGAQSSLTIYDLAALRYGVSACIALPFVLYYQPWKNMNLGRIIKVTLLLGPLYILFVFSGFNYAPAAHGGIFMNGAIPALTLFIAWLWFSEIPRRVQIAGVVLILVGGLLAIADASQLSLRNSWIGDLMFLLGGLFFSCYLVANRRWGITATQVLLCGSVLNAFVYVPIWWLFLPSGFESASHQQIYLQLLYQGLVPNLLGLLLVGVAVKHIGSAPTAAFMAAVPPMGTLLSLLFLGETLGFLGWLSLLVLTPGIVMVALANRKMAKPEVA